MSDAIAAFPKVRQKCFTRLGRFNNIVVSNTHYGALININSKDLDIITHSKILDTVWNSSKLTTELLKALKTSQLCFILTIDPTRFFL
jgi:hypothetical protein